MRHVTRSRLASLSLVGVFAWSAPGCAGSQPEHARASHEAGRGGAWEEQLILEADAGARTEAVESARAGRATQWPGSRSAQTRLRPAEFAGRGTAWEQSRGETMMQVIDSSPNHEAFAAALRSTRVDEEIESLKDFTILAPVDFAFERLSPEVVSDLHSPRHRDQLEQFVRGHIIPGHYSEQELIDAETLTTLAGTKVRIGDHDGKARLGVGDAPSGANGVSVLQSNPTRTGVVHQIDDVLWP